MSTETIHIAGRYNKYLRNLSQSPWIDKDDVRVKDSVQELIEDGLKKYLKFDKSIFASSGREDVDVRMLGRGRPFTFRIQNPQFIADYNPATLRKIEEFVNTKHVGKVKVRDLQIVTKSDVTKYMTDTLDSKQKEYRALCCCSRQLTMDDFVKINNLKDLVIEQMTPIRVLHRRTWATRKRTIYNLHMDALDDHYSGDVRAEHRHRLVFLTLTTEAGTYIKEFVHGDFGRTRPNLSSLLGDCETDLMELDVMEVHSDWPPEIVPRQDVSIDEVESSKQKVETMDDKMDNSEEALSDIYCKAMNYMEEAEKKPRGDARQELYIKARRLFEKSQSLIENLSLFSDNEPIDDVATTDLKYLLTHAHLAKIYLTSECGPNRLDTFTKANNHIRSFLRQICDYNLGSNEVEYALKENNCDIIQSIGREPVTLETAMQQRTAKIEKLKKTRELEERLEELKKRMNSCTKDQVDDELVREYYLELIKKTVGEMVENLELEIKPALIFEKGRSSFDDQLNQSNDAPAANVPKPFTIVKNQLQKQVFGIGYPSRPTVTVDEFITKKINEGDLVFDKHKEVYANSLQRYAEQPNLRRDQEELSDEERDLKEDRHEDSELQRKRKWDEFKDDNPRGSGNRHNMG